MPLPFEPYVHDAARRAARVGTTRLAAGFTVAAGACLISAPLAAWLLPGWALPAVAWCGGLLVVHAVWTLQRVRRHYRVLTSVHVSAAGLGVRDAGGYDRTVPWTRVAHVNVSGGGVEVVVRYPGRRHRLRFGPDWPDAAGLARQIVRHAEAHRRPICVDGVACDALSLAALGPALSPAPDADVA